MNERQRQQWSQDHQSPTLTTALVAMVLAVAGFIAVKVVNIDNDISGMKEHILAVDARIARLNHKVFPGEYYYDQR
jgi:hypothetical protein